jgi:hypothetical protein
MNATLEEGFCPQRQDESHCECWWDDGECCNCGYGPHKETKMGGSKIEACAAAAHHVNKAWCEAHGDFSQPNWADASDDIKASAINGVEGVLRGNTPQDSHRSWLDFKRADGWVYGKVKDLDAKTHPCMVPYIELPEMQKAKDLYFVSTVRAVALALGLPFSAITD